MSGIEKMIDISSLQDPIETEEIFFRATYPKFEEQYLIILNSNPLFSYIHSGLLAIGILLYLYLKYSSKKLNNKVLK